MKLPVNKRTAVRLWWPTRLLVQTSATDYELKLVGFGKTILINPRVAMRSTPNLACVSVEYHTTLWRDQAAAVFNAHPELAVVSEVQIDEFINRSISSNLHLENTDPEQCVLKAFASLMED